PGTGVAVVGDGENVGRHAGHPFHCDYVVSIRFDCARACITESSKACAEEKSMAWRPIEQMPRRSRSSRVRSNRSQARVVPPQPGRHLWLTATSECKRF